MTRRIKHDYPIEILFDWANGEIDIPLDWTPAQADQIVTILGQVDERIWALYGDDLVELARAQTYVGHSSDCDTDSPYEPDEDIPF